MTGVGAPRPRVVPEHPQVRVPVTDGGPQQAVAETTAPPGLADVERVELQVDVQVGIPARAGPGEADHLAVLVGDELPGQFNRTRRHRVTASSTSASRLASPAGSTNPV